MPSVAAGADIPLVTVRWRPCYRVLPSRLPPVDLFERIADPADLDAMIALESLTNDRIREQVGKLSLVPPADRISGPGSSVIMAAFTHPNPDGSRFSDGSYGVFYAGDSQATAIAETRYHRQRFMQATRERPMEIGMRVHLTDIDGELHELRGPQPSHQGLYHPQDYAVGQQLGAGLRGNGSSGVVYTSVRHPDGQCIGVFRPPLLHNCRQGAALSYVWDGTSISAIYQRRYLDD